MPTIYKITGKNSGKDVSITITDSDGNQVNAAQLGILTHFEVEADYVNWETKSIVNGGQVFHESLPHGAKCMMKFSRSGPGLEDMESNYRKKSQQGRQLSYTIQYQTQNPDGTHSTRRLVTAKPHNWKLGSYSPDADVTQGVDFVSLDLEANGANSGLFN